MRNYLLLVLTFIGATALSAQFQLSNRLDLYSGINGAFLQPAGTVATPYNWDLNVAHINSGFSNDYGFLANASAIGLLRDARQDLTADVDELNQQWALGNRLYAYDFNNNGKPHFGGFAVDVLGPAFSVQIGEWTRVGAFVRARVAANARGIDANFSYYPYDEREDGTTFNLAETFGAAAAWTEYGVHLAQAIPLNDDTELRLGVNARYLLPLEGGYLFNPGNSTYGKVNVDSISVEGGTTEIAFSNVLRETDDIGGASGSGFGIDFGAQIAWEPMREGGYRYVAGISVIDAGLLNFDDGAEQHLFANPDRVFIGSDAFDGLEGQEDVDEFIGVLNEIYYGRRGVSLQSESFTIGLPTVISAQFAFQPVSDLRLSAAYAGGVNVNDRQLKAGQQLALAAHFSRWWYGAGITTALHDWQYFNLGAQLRLGPLTLGTDRFFGTLAKAKRLQAADFYIGLKFHNFGLKKADRKGQFNRPRNSRRVKCYEW
ncbi:hypothetical protein CEQ90_17200 [Lewinellaceae bacterium SD302]|nr:hypothetical protein CEQ90_17200 [Lewinellaceae bacterium SD302]